MNKAIVMIAIAVVAAVGISAFALMPSESSPLPAPVVQEPMIEKPTVLEEEISILDNNSFSAPTTIAQSMKAAQPAPNVTIGDDGKIYVLYQDTVNEQTNIFLKTSTDNGQTFSEPVRVNLDRKSVV